MKKIILAIVLAMLCLFFKMQAKGQTYKTAPLKIGDRLPSYFWTAKHQFYRNGKVTLEDLSLLKGNILVIDFWASWCTNCIDKFPKVAALAKRFKGVANVVLVNTKGNNDNEHTINTLYEKLNKTPKTFTLPSIIEDTLINQLLPHTFLPHYMWFNREGRLVAITNSDFVGDEPISSMHQNDLRLDSLRKKRKELSKL
jgi:thiol-disulfide isomerase/thioredoxin